MRFEPFDQVVKNPKKQLEKYLEQGKKVIGCFHLYTPEQIIYAAGFLPFGMWGGEVEVRDARRYFPESICGIIKTDFEMALNGMLDGMSAVVIPTLCDSLRCATQNWRYAVPEVEMIPIAYPQNRESKASFSYLYEQYKGVIEKLEQIGGRKVTEEDLSRAVKIYNEHNQVMRRFLELAGKYPKEISPLNRNYVVKSSYFMDKEEHTRLVEELITQLESVTPKRFRGIKVVTTGICADSEELLKIFENNRVAIAADEVAQESRQFRVDAVMEGDSLAALANQYLNMYACSTVMDGVRREQYILDLVKKTKADGVIIVHTKFCDPEEYDAPIIKKTMDENQIPLLVIEVDKQIRNYGQAATAVQSFQEMIRL